MPRDASASNACTEAHRDFVAAMTDLANGRLTRDEAMSRMFAAMREYTTALRELGIDAETCGDARLSTGRASTDIDYAPVLEKQMYYTRKSVHDPVIKAGSAYDVMMGKARVAHDRDPSRSVESHFAKIYANGDRQNTELVLLHKAEERASRPLLAELAGEYHQRHRELSPAAAMVRVAATRHGAMARALDRDGYSALMAKAADLHATDPSRTVEQYFAKLHASDVPARTAIRKEEGRAA